MEDALLRLYNQDLIRLSRETEEPRRLAHPSATAKAVSPICGSVVSIDINVEDGRVTDLGYEIEACALTKCTVAVMKKAAIGKTQAQIAKAGQEIEAMLAGGPPPGGDWTDLKILAPVADYKARYNAMLLPFEAIEKAFAQIKE